jgi:hypothetical protein
MRVRLGQCAIEAGEDAMNTQSIPNLTTFMTAPDTVVAANAPATAIYMPGGTRRRAVLEGVSLGSDYLSWTRAQIVPTAALFFRLGVQHLFFPLVGQRQTEETTFYGDRLVTWIKQGLGSAEMLEEYRRQGWRVRMIVLPSLPALADVATSIQQATAEAEGPTLWLYMVFEYAAYFREIIGLIQQTDVHSQQEAIRAFYGVDVPPASLYIGFGKLTVGTAIIPPFLLGDNLHCYWTQRAGFSITEAMLRRIIYDYAYTRPTWSSDHSARYNDVAQDRELWDTEAVIGTGARIGGFWYPDSVIGATQQRSVGETSEEIS